MSPSTVRWGGIMVFVGIALLFIIPIVYVAVVGIEGMARPSTGAAGLPMQVPMNVAMAAIVAFVFLTTKGYFNALGYRNADIVIYFIIGVQLVSGVISAITNTSSGLEQLVRSGGVSAIGAVGIVVLVITLIGLIAMLIFSIFCISFGNIGGGVWKAIGILYLIGIVGIIIGAVIIIVASAGVAMGSGNVGGRGIAGVAILSVIIIVIAGLCYCAAVICHGIGLILGAGRMERELNPAEVFD